MQVLIVEDDELIAMDMERIIESMGHQVTGLVNNSADALQLLNDQYVDLAILDIRIQGNFDGIELAEKISVMNEKMHLLFVTSMQDDLTFNRATRSQPGGFIVKPFSEIQFRRTVELIFNQMEANADEDESRRLESDVQFSPEGLFVRKRQEIRNILFRDIEYLEADGGKYSKIFLKDDVFVIRYSLKNLIDKIKSEDFIQCHRSYVVNIKKIKSVDLTGNEIHFKGRRVPISRREKKNLIDKLDYL